MRQSLRLYERFTVSSTFYRTITMEAIDTAMASEDPFRMNKAEELKRQIDDLDGLGLDDSNYKGVYEESFNL